MEYLRFGPTPDNAVQALLRKIDATQSICTAWKNAFECIEAHIKDRIAMNDAANPSVYLNIIQSEVANVEREGQAIVNARWADAARLQQQIDRLTRVNAEALSALKGLAALNRTPDRFASEELRTARAVIAKMETA